MFLPKCLRTNVSEYLAALNRIQKSGQKKKKKKGKESKVLPLVLNNKMHVNNITALSGMLVLHGTFNIM